MTTTDPIPPPHPAEELLSQGAPGGPRLDRVWARVEAQLDQQDAQQRAEVRRRAWWYVLPLVFSTAAAMFLMVPSSTSTLTARGNSDVTPPQLLATCGTAAQPCQVEVPIFLKLAPHEGGGHVYVALVTAAGPQLLAGPVPSSSQPTPITSKLVPDPADRGTTLRLQAVWSAQPVEGDAVRALFANTNAPRSTLNLWVAP